MTMVRETERLNQITSPLLAWYDANRRALPWREEVSPYRTWVSEIMLQQTRVQAALPYFQRFMGAAPDAAALAALPEQRLMALWQGLGYYSRARNLQRAAVVLAEQYGGALPCTYEELRALPGIGDYTAGAILSIAYGQAVPAVDGNVLRIVARLTGYEGNVLDGETRKIVREWMAEVVPADRPGDFNQALMDLGAAVCLPGDIVYGCSGGVLFIPPQLVVEVVENGVKTQVKDIFGFEMIAQNRFTTAQIDLNVWTEEMLDLLVEFIKTDPRGAEYRDLDWSHEYALARAGGDGGQSAL